MRISDWSSDVCSSDLDSYDQRRNRRERRSEIHFNLRCLFEAKVDSRNGRRRAVRSFRNLSHGAACHLHYRSEEHTSELQSLMRTSYAVFCLKKKKQQNTQHTTNAQMTRSTYYNPPTNTNEHTHD